MSIPDIVQVVSTVGFPIVCCGGLAWYVKYVTDKEREMRVNMQKEHNEEMKKITDEHRNEMKEVTTALNNNTLAIQRLCDKLGDYDGRNR